MMQPDEEQMYNKEHEIVFDDDDDCVEQEPFRSAPKTALHTTEAILHQPLASFQPLEAVHSTEAVTAAMRLESFLSSANSEINLVSTAPIQNASIHPIRSGSSFDPYAKPTTFIPPKVSLFDAVDDLDDETGDDDDVEMTHCRIPGAAGFLEMEEEPSTIPTPSKAPLNSCSIFDPIQTSSGLLLTHRRVPPSQAAAKRTRSAEGTAFKSRRRRPSSPTFHSSTFMWQTFMHPKFPTSFPPLLRCIRLWVAVSAAILFFGTAVLVHHSFQANSESSSVINEKFAVDETISFHEENGIFTLEGPNEKNIQLVPLTDDTVVPDQIILLPFPSSESGLRHTKQRRLSHLQVSMTPAEGVTGLTRPEESLQERRKSRFPLAAMGALKPLQALKSEFESWKIRHNKTYHSKEEHRRRFQIWSDNRHRTSEKNARHGPCQLTGKPVFGVNQFHDLTDEEFQSQYLNGYHLKREPIRKGAEPEQPIMGMHVEPPQIHPTVRERLLEQKVHASMGLDYQGNCKWYDVSCILRYLFSTFLYGLGGTMEPAYDANSYPTSVDWRSLGAVTDVHSQGSCGACWAITAVETVESAYFISTGKLYDLAETEVIVCESKCEMCAGGWPQEAFDYVIANNGLPLESDMSYNADFLLLVSEHVAGNSDELDDSTVSTYQQQTCPSGGGGNDNHSGDSQSISGSNTFTRYGKIKGYGYSTEKCVCYTDGSGCDCDHQNEGYAVRNLATYGPAVVCLDASTWQDYTEGIITSESGCSAGFMDVNHCVQAVGYAYMSDEEYQDEMDGKNSGDRNQNSKDGSRDSTQRKGYWIVRNQWSRYWGMNGYAYVAMGENTCGILNDMMQAYT